MGEINALWVRMYNDEKEEFLKSLSLKELFDLQLMISEILVHDLYVDKIIDLR